MVGAVFLDRDGVLNEAPVCEGRPHPPATVEEVVILPGVVEAIDKFHRAGLMCVVITNQPDVARGTSAAEAVEAINAVIADRTGVDLVVSCMHDDADGCSCRKPLPGMILDTAIAHGLDLRRSVVVGDRWRDVAAGDAAGVPTVFVDRGYTERQPDCANLVVKELVDAVPWILTVTSKGRTT